MTDAIQFDKDMLSEHRQLFEMARKQLLEIDGMEEVRKPRITTFSVRGGGICHMRTMPHGIDFGFLKGALMDDPAGRLHGNGKKMRVLSLTEYDHGIVQGFLEQAVELVG